MTAFGACGTGEAAIQPGQEAVVVREVAKPRLQPVLARTIRIAADHHGAHVVVQHLMRCSAEERNAASWQSVTNCAKAVRL